MLCLQILLEIITCWVDLSFLKTFLFQTFSTKIFGWIWRMTHIRDSSFRPQIRHGITEHRQMQITNFEIGKEVRITSPKSLAFEAKSRQCLIQAN